MNAGRTMLAAAALAAGTFAAAGAAREEVAVVETPEGPIVWRFFPDAAPQHAAYVKELIRRGFYDGTLFHRVIPGFVVQGGDPNSKNADRSDDGEGEGDRRVPAEFSQTLHYRPGTVGMARDADPNTGSCQFFIALETLPRLDGKYTIFGEVISGLETARRIALKPRDLNDNPLLAVPVRIRLEGRRIPDRVLSRETADPGGPGERTTGPSRARLYDPGNRRWSAPERTAPGTAPAGAGRLDLVTDETGRVLDVRFPDVTIANAAAVAAQAMGWSFWAGRFDGNPVKTRFSCDLEGGSVGPPTGGGAPEIPGVAGAGSVSAPRPLIRVDLPSGVRAPAGRTTLRLTVDAAGGVTEASVQQSSGDEALDARAVDAAKRLVFAPATKPAAKSGQEPEPVAAWIDAEARFVEAPAAP